MRAASRARHQVRARAARRLPAVTVLSSVPHSLLLPLLPSLFPGTKNATRTMLARQSSSARGSLPPANVRTGFSAAAAYDDDPDPSGAALDEQPLMSAGRTPTLATQTRRR